MDDKITASKVMEELHISRSYLYKLKQEHQIFLPKEANGRYRWNKEAIEQLQLILDIPQQSDEEIETEKLLNHYQVKQFQINNRRYLGNKFALSEFIRNVVDENCTHINVVADLFCGTGSVANAFQDKLLITNDLLYCNYLSNYAWFSAEDYSKELIIKKISEYNQIKTDENNYMREFFSDTFFNANTCSKIGFIREDIQNLYINKKINFKEYSILITSLIYAMDKIANTVGHYDAYRKNGEMNKPLILSAILPTKNKNNHIFNQDINKLIDTVECDLLYLDPPYNSRQYGDAYHLLENVAKWEKPIVYGVARKMDRSHIKSDYCTTNATRAFEELINKAKCKYILLSYNNMSNKGNERSNAKISDDDIMRILTQKGKVTIFEKNHKAFSTGKSEINDNSERLFLCEVFSDKKNNIIDNVASPLNYTGGKFKILDQLNNIFIKTDCFLDLFTGGANVGVNSLSSKIILNDNNKEVINLLNYFYTKDIDNILKEVEDIIAMYKLSMTSMYGYEYYNCNSSDGLAKFNKDPFFKLREDYNKSKLKNPAMLYVLIVYAFNNQIRFNKKGEFNLPVGKRDFNNKMKNKLISFCRKMKNKDIEFVYSDFKEINLNRLSNDTLIYCDPPYLITTASYNENGGWTEINEKELLYFLNQADEKGIKFALSNVLEAKGKENIILKNWINKYGFKVHFIQKDYSNSNYQRKDKDSPTIEVLITNY